MTETIRSKRPGPCMGCPDRYPGCSDHCQKPEYLAYREELARIRKAKKEYQNPAWTTSEMDPGNYRKRRRFK